MNCLNCNTEFNDQFCPNCGQNSNVSRINSKFLFQQIPDNLLQLNRGLFFTIVSLFKRPGHAIREFIEGKRKPFFKPIAYAVLFSTLYALLANYFNVNTFLQDAFEGFINADSETEEEMFSFVNDLSEWVKRNYAYSILILSLIMPLASFLVFFKSKYNYFEHYILNAFLIGQKAIFFLIMMIVSELFSFFEYYQVLAIYPGIIYTYWVYIQFFKLKTFKGILLSSATYMLYLAFLFLIMFIVLGFVELNLGFRHLITNNFTQIIDLQLITF